MLIVKCLLQFNRAKGYLHVYLSINTATTPEQGLLIRGTEVRHQREKKRKVR